MNDDYQPGGYMGHLPRRTWGLSTMHITGDKDPLTRGRFAAVAAVAFLILVAAIPVLAMGVLA